jgi:ribosomal protein S18 acetylase RimI-like enzyme
MRYRHFRNTDPPALATLWNESLSHRGAVEIHTPSIFDVAVFNKPYFDPHGLIVAENDVGKIVGFSHVGFGPNEDQDHLDTTQGVVCAVLVHPEHRRQKIGRNLLNLGEAYLQEKGATHLQAGPSRPAKPFYVGMYGGSNAAGFLQSDKEAEPFFLAHGYAPEGRVLVFDRALDSALNIADTRFTAMRRKYETAVIPQARLGSWWRECVIGPLEPAEFRLDDKQTGQTAAKALFWEMKEYGWRWGMPAAGILDLQVRSDLRRQGFGKYLLAQLLRHLQEEYFGIAEVQIPERDESMGTMFRSLGFVQVDIGVTYQKSATP